jgi:hypothetical protein
MFRAEPLARIIAEIRNLVLSLLLNPRAAATGIATVTLVVGLLLGAEGVAAGFSTQSGGASGGK